MFITRAFSALLVASLPLSSLALDTGRPEIPADLLERSLAAIGIKSDTVVRNVRISGNHFRTKSIMVTISLDSMDQSVVTRGSQTLTFSYEEPGLKQRIDKLATFGTVWFFARPTLQPMDYSLVVRDGDEGFAAVTRGSYAIFDPDAPPEGYLDGYLAAYIISNSRKYDPFLLRTISQNNHYSLRHEEVEEGLMLPAVFDHTFNMSVLINPTTYLPFAIRTWEDHPFFGPSTKDLRVSDYTSVDGLMIPRRFKTKYNNKRLINDFLANEVSIDVNLGPTFFNVNGERKETHIPVVDPSQTALIGEQYDNYLWFGRFNSTVDDFDVQQPFPDMPGVWILRLPGVASYRQIVLETETHAIVLDAPPEPASILREWIRIHLGKPVGQVFPTHHHHDHAFGARHFVEHGASIIAPKMATSYYAGIPGVTFNTYDHDTPYVIETDTYRASFIHVEGSVHATDMSVAVIMPPCPNANSTVVVFDADHVTQSQWAGTHNDHNEIAQLIASMSKHRVAKSATFVSVHGQMSTMDAIYESYGYLYPEYTALDFTHGSGKCANTSSTQASSSYSSLLRWEAMLSEEL
ncbi:hypothetical protein IAQ61_010184 [Plenodomus lingam]|uniref:Metallo-beta-lactamase domain-containing protein n=1 Tax=Leptosphaeria maculans (strain JN3 / isolate v23.1.3 / race Av1-4-5-6-7-8) TaxID=985895 RepID=E5A368_LEPMJ|nr:hypothetical protein LEMA_P094900.1 [Plenodomus lingam JN3]KAH9861983.1 hypothetical protein IAQ61_010184 [Plenodomus lingam]CBX98081.1 hypothetical protein LEMA_P094900.1 [Plenodomus lingam JN3]